jgi:transposase
MARPSRYPPELRERAVRMVAEVLPNYPSEWPAMVAVADKLGIGTATGSAHRRRRRMSDQKRLTAVLASCAWAFGSAGAGTT